MIKRNPINYMHSKLVDTLMYFADKIQAHLESDAHTETKIFHCRFYEDACRDLLLVDEAETFKYIQTLEDARQLRIVATALNNLVVKYTNWRILKVFKEKMDKYGNASNQEWYFEAYANAVEYVKWFHEDKVASQTYINMIVYNHTERNLRYLRSHGFEIKIEHIYANGVRVGHVPAHPDIESRLQGNMTWFPVSWQLRDLDEAVKFVHSQYKSVFNELPDGGEVSAFFRGVKVVIRKDLLRSGRYDKYNIPIVAVFPDKTQPD